MYDPPSVRQNYKAVSNSLSATAHQFASVVVIIIVVLVVDAKAGRKIIITSVDYVLKVSKEIR